MAVDRRGEGPKDAWPADLLWYHAESEHYVHLWVRESNDRGPEGDPRWWTIFDPEGRWLGRSELPGDLDVREIGTDHVLGVHTSEMGIERVRLHRLRPGGGGH